MKDLITQALHTIRDGSTIKGTARQFKIPESTLRHRMKMLQNGKELVGSGRKTALTADMERDLAHCIQTLFNAGFSPSADEVKNLVKDFVVSNKLKTPFKDGRPGKDWFKKFLSRQKLSTKKATMISAARKAATANPFIIYDFYEVIDKVITENNLSPKQIWNCDESGFPTDPSKYKVVAPIGKAGWKTTCGAGRENITVLATCSASGRALDPLILFSGKNFQSTWKGSAALPQTMYGVSDNGWMTTNVFSDWFDRFAEVVEERPLVLIYDGHLSHVSLEVIEKSMRENITIVKFPPHVTDKLQPLDVSCFSPLKRKWQTLLAQRGNVLGSRETISKPVFVDLLCSIWHQGLSAENSISGFRCTGIYPVDKDKYPVERFDPRLLKRYNLWVKQGKPAEMMEDLATAVNTPKKLQPEPSNNSATNELPALPADQPSTSSSTLPSTPATGEVQPQHFSTPLETCCCNNCKDLGPKPPAVPPQGWTWSPVWTLKRDGNKSFEELSTR